MENNKKNEKQKWKDHLGLKRRHQNPEPQMSENQRERQNSSRDDFYSEYFCNIAGRNIKKKKASPSKFNKQ